MAQIVCAGQALVDCIFLGGNGEKAESITLAPGGDAFNEAVNLARLGCDTALRCRLGPDMAGHLLMEQARQAGVDLSLADVGGQTPVSALYVDDRGERRSTVSKLHDLEGFVPEAGGFAGAQVVTVASLFRPPFNSPETVLRFAQAVKNTGALLFADVKTPRGVTARMDDYMAVFPYLDFIAPNADEARYYTGLKSIPAMGEAFLKAGVKTVLLKLGRDGCLIMTERERIHIPAYAVMVADGIGAGDAFAAGFIYGITSGRSLRESGRVGAAAAALCVQQRGAVGGVKSLEQVLGWLENPGAPLLPEMKF